MKIYLVWGIEWQVGKELFGVYDSLQLAEDRLRVVSGGYYNEYSIEEIDINSNIE
jgi:hypothetical protein